MTGQVRAIHLAAVEGAPMQVQERAELVAGKGIVGDRNFCEQGTEPAEQVTLVEEEQVEYFNRRCGRSIETADTRRNVATRGIDLNALVGRDFMVGSARLRGVELCEPCATIGGLLQTKSQSAAEVVRTLRGRAGLRASIVEGGVVALGDPIRLVDGD